jgi:hypothetical protein
VTNIKEQAFLISELNRAVKRPLYRRKDILKLISKSRFNILAVVKILKLSRED